MYASQIDRDIDNFQEKVKRVSHKYAIGNLSYVDITGIYRKLDYKKYGIYGITEVYTNGKCQAQKVQVS